METLCENVSHMALSTAIVKSMSQFSNAIINNLEKTAENTEPKNVEVRENGKHINNTDMLSIRCMQQSNLYAFNVLSRCYLYKRFAFLISIELRIQQDNTSAALDNNVHKILHSTANQSNDQDFLMDTGKVDHLADITDVVMELSLEERRANSKYPRKNTYTDMVSTCLYKRFAFFIS